MNRQPPAVPSPAVHRPDGPSNSRAKAENNSSSELLPPELAAFYYPENLMTTFTPAETAAYNQRELLRKKAANAEAFWIIACATGDVDDEIIDYENKCSKELFIFDYKLYQARQLISSRCVSRLAELE